MLDQMLQGVQNITPTTTPETLSVVPGIGLVGMGSPTGMPSQIITAQSNSPVELYPPSTLPVKS